MREMERSYLCDPLFPGVSSNGTSAWTVKGKQVSVSRDTRDRVLLLYSA